MSRGRHEVKRGRRPAFPIDQMVPREPDLEELPRRDPEPPVVTNPAPAGPTAPGGDDGGRATGSVNLDLVVTPERPAAPPRPTAAIWVASEVAVTPVGVPVDPVPPLQLADLAPAPEAPEGLAVSPPPARAPRRRGAHVRPDDPLADEVRGAFVKAEVRGAHVKAGDPLAVEVEAEGAPEVEALVDVTTGTWVPRAEASAVDGSGGGAASQASAGGVKEAGARDAELKKRAPAEGRRRRWPFLSMAGVAAALVAGLSAGAAYGYFTSSGSGMGSSVVGSPVSVTVTAVSGAADLLPGDTGAIYFTLHNPNPFGAKFTQVTTVGPPVSVNTVACPSSNLSIAQSLPFPFWPAITVGGGATSSSESIANFVQLAADAPNSCQGVTFTVTLTLSGTST